MVDSPFKNADLGLFFSRVVCNILVACHVYFFFPEKKKGGGVFVVLISLQGILSHVVYF